MAIKKPNFSKKKPKEHIGIVHPSLQKYDSSINSIHTLRLALHQRGGDPLCNWTEPAKTETVADEYDFNASFRNITSCNFLPPDEQHPKPDLDSCDITTWFPNDNRPAFYTPIKNFSDNEMPSDFRAHHGPQRYHTLTYRQLHEQIRLCPPFILSSEGVETGLLSGPRSPTSSSCEVPIVALILPAELMAEMAVVILSTIAAGAVVAPIDPRTPTLRVLEAIHQLKCTHAVSTTSLLADLRIFRRYRGEDFRYHDCYVTDSSFANDVDDQAGVKHHLDYFMNNVVDVRTITPEAGGCIKWNIFSKNNINPQIWVPCDSARLFESKNTLGTATTRGEAAPALLLRTSGTTSTPKVVPITASHLLFSSICIASSLELSRADVCCNAMPFYHIGGIACNLLSILISGSAVIHSGPFKDPSAFLNHLLLPAQEEHAKAADIISATWYYAAPPIHKAILYTAESHLCSGQFKTPSRTLPNKLRFIRSAAAHLNHEVVLRLSEIFDTHIIPTYGMSEAMPICSSIPIHYKDESVVVDSVGYPIGNSIRIINKRGAVLRKGDRSGPIPVGEISVRGPGVIRKYIDLDTQKTHTKDGFLKTGDVGYMDNEGRIFIKGRIKEMIKRGGEQIWPNQIDDLVEKVPGVSTAVAFGVPNELWGEEVAVAAVLKDATPEIMQSHEYLDFMRKKVITACAKELDDASVPRQVKFLKSQTELLRGPTGKYMRSKMASHLKMSAVDVGALRALKGMNVVHTSPATQSSTSRQTRNSSIRIVPSKALNGMRFLTACFVVQHHVGLFPFNAWIKLQAFSLSMTIFFALGAFQATCSVSRSVENQWASFVGNKIGTLHALFIVTQLIALPSYLIFWCTPSDDFKKEEDSSGIVGLRCGSSFLVKTLIIYVLNTFTGILGFFGIVNEVSWFQSAFYMYIIAFPFLDSFFRRKSYMIWIALLFFFTLVASGLSPLLMVLTMSNHQKIFLWLYFTIVNWGPTLVAAMVMGYIFRFFLLRYYEKERSLNPETTNETYIVDSEDLRNHSRVWGVITDLMSLVLLAAAVVVAISPNCACVRTPVYEQMRLGEQLPNTTGCTAYTPKDLDYIKVCDVTHDEYINYIFMDPEDEFNYGRWMGEFGGSFGLMRLGTCFVLLWIYSMAFGNGITALILGSKPFRALANLSYPIYLLHVPVARYYWIATRGLNPEVWWNLENIHPIPVYWYEFLLILGITMLLGALINEFIVPCILPCSVTFGVRFCKQLSRFMQCLVCKRRCCKSPEDSSSELESKSNTSSYEQVQVMVRGLTGAEVDGSLKLKHLGLDSLGATAFLGMLRANVLAAKNLTMKQLKSCGTIQDLATMLDEDSSDTSSSLFIYTLSSFLHINVTTYFNMRYSS